MLVFHLIKKKKELKKFQDKVDLRYIKLLNRRTATDKVLHGKGFNIDKGPKDNGHQRGLASMIYKFFEKKTFETRIFLIEN